jgi:hypothetical protein
MGLLIPSRERERKGAREEVGGVGEEMQNSKFKIQNSKILEEAVAWVRPFQVFATIQPTMP